MKYFISLRTKLILAFLVFILIPIFGVGVYSYNQFEDVLSSQLTKEKLERLHQVNRNIDRELALMQNSAMNLILDETVKKVLNHLPTTDRDRLDNAALMDKKFLEITTTIMTQDVYLTLIDNKGNLYTNWGQSTNSFNMMSQSRWYQKAMEQNGYMAWDLNNDSYIYPFNNKMVTLAMVIKDKTYKQNLGMLVISEPAQYFIDMLKVSDTFSTDFGFIVPDKGDLLGADPEQMNRVYPLLPKQLKDSEETFVVEWNGEPVEVMTNKLSQADWHIIQIVPQKEIFKPITKIRNIATVILIISMAIFIGLVIFATSMITRPLRKLNQLMKEVEFGNLQVAVEVQTHDEIGVVGRNFNHMLTKLRHHISNEVVLVKSREKAKLEALQAQINPHFLHNTLNTIKWMSIMAGTKDVTEMLLSLGHLLDMSIHRGQEVIRVQEEMENVRSFLTIQKYRFGDTIEIVEDIEPETLDALVPKLSLQPLVENVYQHGLFIDGGKMIIRSRIVGEDLFLQVIDNGAGLSNEKLEEINWRLNCQGADSLSRIGIKNVHDRIQMMFGQAYGLRIERDAQAKGTSVTIHLPCRRDISVIADGGH